MAGVTEQGFVSKSYQEIITEIGTYLKTNLGIDINSNPDSVAKIITNILALSTYQNWAATESLQSMFDIDQATGVWLENLCKLKLITRKAGSYSTGKVQILSNGSFTLPVNSLFSDDDGNSFFSMEEVRVSPENTIDVSLTLTIGNIGDVVSLQVNGELCTATITAENIVDGSWKQDLVDSVNAKGVTSYYQGSMLFISNPIPFSVTNTVKVWVSTFTTEVNIAYNKLGDYTFTEDTITKYPSFTNIVRATNNLPISGGSLDETDDELRIRFKSTQSIGKATTKAIRSALLAVSGVTSVSVLENDTDVEDPVFGIPPHSILVSVEGGNDSEVGQTLYDVKGASIRTAGNTTVLVKDSSDNDEAVKFERIANKYIHVRITYNKYNEEAYPTDGDDTIKEAVVEYINSLGINKDVIQGRVLGVMYNAVTGVGYAKVELATTTNFDDTPTTWYDITPIEVLRTQTAFTALSKIQLVEV